MLDRGYLSLSLLFKLKSVQIKKYLLLFFCAASFSLLAFANTSTEPVIEEEEEVCVKEEGLRCRVKIGQNEASCWFCNCSELAKSLQRK